MNIGGRGEEEDQMIGEGKGIEEEEEENIGKEEEKSIV